jgi:hypothetical protein
MQVVVWTTESLGKLYKISQMAKSSKCVQHMSVTLWTRLSLEIWMASSVTVDMILRMMNDQFSAACTWLYWVAHFICLGSKISSGVKKSSWAVNLWDQSYGPTLRRLSLEHWIIAPFLHGWSIERTSLHLVTVKASNLTRCDVGKYKQSAS